jgi:hypothetical protein
MKPKLLLCLALVLSGNSHAAIVYPKAPDGGRQIVFECVSQMLKEYPDGPVLAEPGLKVADVSVAEPFGLYYVGLTNLAAGKLLSVAESSSWQYLLLHGTSAVGAVTLKQTNGKLIFAGLYETDCSNETLKALRIAGQLPQVKKQDYELRRLDDPSILFVAIWLHGKSDDIIIPLPNTFGRWNAYQAYSESQMIKLLQPEAKRDAEMWMKLNEQNQKNEDAYRQAMMEYEKAHGDKCGSIFCSGMSGPFQVVGPDVEILRLQGTSSECGKLDYKVKITYGDNRGIVKKVEVLEKITQ